MRGVLDEWINELPQQFQNKKNIAVLIKALSRQYDKLIQVFEELNAETDLDTAVGKNLDMVGNILSLDRKEAHIVIRKSKQTEITDEIYRQVLRYQAIRNNTDCTYYDIMDSMSLLWDTENVKYMEDPNHPAMISLNLPTIDIEGIDPAIGKILAIKPSGVGMLYHVGYQIPITLSGLETVSLSRIHMKVLFNWWNTKMLDGTFLLDGTYLLDAVRGAMEFRIRHGAILVQQEEEFQEVEVELRHHYWTLDGSYRLDGERLLSATIEREAL